jgi:hypothetical protein
MFARIGLRTAQQTLRQTTFRLKQRRTQSTLSDSAQAIPKNENAFLKFLNGPTGWRTVHFWAPIMKVRFKIQLSWIWMKLLSSEETDMLEFAQWGLVLAGAADFARPASQLSLSQNAALTATGFIWTRWCFIIKPRNIFLASVNFLLGCVGITQVVRVLLYQRSIAGVEGAVKEEGRALEKAVKNPEAVKEAVEHPSK